MKMKIVKLDTLVWFQEGPGVRNTQYTKKGVKLINVTNLVDGLLDLSLTSRYISEEEAYGKYKHFLCDEGDLVIASSGITYDSIPNKVSFIRKSDLPLCMNTSVIRFKSLDSKKVNIKYLYYFFKSNCFRNQISKLMTGSAQLNFGPSHLHKVFIPICEKEKQDHIVESLDNLYLAANSISKEVSLFDELIRTRFIEMFGYHCSLQTDTEVIAYIADYLLRRRQLSLQEMAWIVSAPFWSVLDRQNTREAEQIAYLRKVFPSLLLTGPFSIVLGFTGGIMALNDRAKLRSMVVAEKDDVHFVASEEAAIRAIEPDAENVYAPIGGEPIIFRVKEGAF